MSTVGNIIRGPRTWFDTLQNFLSGMMLANDKANYNSFARRLMTVEQLEAAYQGDWIARKIVTIPALDMTRQWREWQAEQDQIEKLEDAERKLGVKIKVRDALIKARLYGGAGIVIGTKDKDPSRPLEVDALGEGCISYLHVVSRHELTVIDGLETDITSPWFGVPRFYGVQTTNAAGVYAPNMNLKVHPSRVVRFIGNPLPRISCSGDGWGDPVLQVVNDAVQAAAATSQTIAQLIQEAKVDFIKIPRLTETFSDSDARDKLIERLTLFNTSKSATNAVVMDQEEEWDRAQITFGGMPDVMESFMVLVAGAADIPVTRMHGRSAAGMNSTGDHDTRNYYDRLKSDQEMNLTPAMSVLDNALMVHALGEVDSDIFYEWSSLWQMDETAKAGMIKTISDAVKNFVDTGIIETSALSKGVQNRAIEEGWFPGLEAALQESESDYVEETLPEQQLKIEAKKVNAAAKNASKPALPSPRPVPALPAPKVGVGDAALRTLYVCREVKNSAEIGRWARTQGFKDLVTNMHVTIVYSRASVDWMKMGEPMEEELTIPAGGPRVVEGLGDEGAVVLLFSSRSLSWRHDDLCNLGCSHDYESYQPHVTITYDGSGVNLAEVVPFQGKILLGPEMFSELQEDSEPDEPDDDPDDDPDDTTDGGGGREGANPFDDNAENFCQDPDTGKFCGSEPGGGASESGPGAGGGGASKPEEISKSWTKVGPQLGSNAGGSYVDTNGTQWYVKTQKSDAHAAHDLIANALYQKAGILVPNQKLVTLEGKPAIASQKLPQGYKQLSSVDDPATVKAAESVARRGFAVDAWLANWDVVGLGRDNLLVSGSGEGVSVARVDQGGSLGYRAQGSPKPADALGPKVNEIDTLRNAGLNKQSARVFDPMSHAEIASSIDRVLAIPDDVIKSVAKQFGAPGIGEKLIARKAWLASEKQSFLAGASKSAAATPAPSIPKPATAGMIGTAAFSSESFAKMQSLGAPTSVNYLKGGAPERVALRKALKTDMTWAEKTEIKKMVLASFQKGYDKAVKKGNAEKAAELQAKSLKYAKMYGHPDLAIKATSSAAANLGFSKSDVESASSILKQSGSSYTAEQQQFVNDLVSLVGKQSAEQIFKAGASKAKSSGLPIDAVGAAHIYAYTTSSTYGQTNAVLRQNKGENIPLKYQNHVNALNSALGQLPNYEGTVWRKISVGPEVVAKYEAAVGKTVVEHAFSSAAKGPDHWAGNVTFEIQSKTGTDIVKLSSHASESEVLFRAGTVFHVDSVEKINNSTGSKFSSSTWRIKMREHVGDE